MKQLIKMYVSHIQSCWSSTETCLQENFVLRVERLLANRSVRRASSGVQHVRSCTLESECQCKTSPVPIGPAQHSFFDVLSPWSGIFCHGLKRLRVGLWLASGFFHIRHICHETMILCDFVSQSKATAADVQARAGRLFACLHQGYSDTRRRCSKPPQDIMHNAMYHHVL